MSLMVGYESAALPWSLTGLSGTNRSTQVSKSARSAEGRLSVLVTMVQMLKSDLIELGSLLLGSFSNSLFL